MLITLQIQEIRDSLSIIMQNQIADPDVANTYFNPQSILSFTYFDGDTEYPDEYYCELQMYQYHDPVFESKTHVLQGVY
jgi:hypothetical protein